jgi:hypothetical protein
MPTIFDPLEDIEYKSEFGASIYLLRGGFPANFDQSGESVPANDIQLTRALVLAAVLQAAEYLKDTSIESGVYALDVKYQRFVIHEWLKLQNEFKLERNDLACFLDEEWLAKHSNGMSVTATNEV